MSATVLGADVGVVFVSHGSGPLVEPRAARLRTAGADVVVVDNAGDLDGVPGARLVEAGENLGFGGGCNLGVAALDPAVRVVCLHNPDVDASPEAIAELARLVRGGAAAAGPALRTHGRIREHGFHYPSVAREAMLAARAVRRAGASPRTGAPADDETPDGRGRHQRGVGRRFASGACLVLDRAAFDAVGGFDDEYFLYAEDLDLWHRMEQAGHRGVFAPQVVVEHAGASGSALDAGSREVLRWLGVEAFTERYGAAGWRPYRAAHRPFLGRIPADEALVATVGDAWRAGRRPREVLGAVRRLMASAVSRPSKEPSARP